MRIFKIVLILVIIFITILISAAKPIPHKRFIVVKNNFKLVSLNQTPSDNQVTKLFKLFKAGPETSTVSETKVVKNQRNIYVEHLDGNSTQQISSVPGSSELHSSSEVLTEQTSSDTKIIPSAFLAHKNESNTQSITSYLEQEQKKIELSNKLSQESIQKYNTEQERLAKDALQKKRNEQTAQRYNSSNWDNSRNKKSNNSNNSSNNVGDILNTVVGSCPVCDALKSGQFWSSSQYSEDVIAWNVWRSRIQNKIMDLSDVSDTPAGTLYTFTFKVDLNGKISNIRVSSTYPSANDKVKQAIESLQGTKILTFPQNTKRKIVDFRGSFLMSFSTHYSSPSDYNDFETIIRTNR